jgi:hypothetical protein
MSSTASATTVIAATVSTTASIAISTHVEWNLTRFFFCVTSAGSLFLVSLLITLHTCLVPGKGRLTNTNNISIHDNNLFNQVLTITLEFVLEEIVR